MLCQNHDILKYVINLFMCLNWIKNLLNISVIVKTVAKFRGPRFVTVPKMNPDYL